MWVRGLFIGLLLAGSASSAETPGEVYQQYVDSVRQLAGPRDEAWRLEWVQRFSQALSSPEAAKEPVICSRILDEMGAIQRGLGQTEAAIETYRQMEDLSAATGDVDGQIVSLENRISLLGGAQNFNADKYGEAASRLRELHEWVLTSKPMQGSELEEALGRYRDDMHGIGNYYRTASKGEELSSEDRTELLTQARDAYAAAYAMQNDNTSLERIGLNLARTEAELGNTSQASEIYNQILALDYTERPRSYIAYQELLTRAAPGTDEYFDGVRQILASEPDAYTVALTQQAAMRLYEVGRFQDAIELLESIRGMAESDGINATNLMLLAAACWREGLLEKAEYYLKLVLQKYPDTPSAARVPAQLEQLQVDKDVEKAQIDEAIRRATAESQTAPPSGDKEPNAGEQLETAAAAVPPHAGPPAESSGAGPETGPGGGLSLYVFLGAAVCAAGTGTFLWRRRRRRPNVRETQ